MAIMDQIIQLISGSPGNAIYQAGLILALGITLGILLGSRQKMDVSRLVLAAGVMLFSRLVLLIVLILGARGKTLGPQALFPPLERAIDAIGTWLIIWAILPVFDRPRWSKVFSGFVLLVIFLTGLVFVLVWYPAAVESGAGYNTGVQETVWEAIQLALLGSAGAYLLLDRRGDWVFKWGMLVVLLLVHVIQFGWAVKGGSVAGWERIGQLLVYPLFVTTAHRKVVGSMVFPLAPAPHATLSEQVERIRLLGMITATGDEKTIVQATLDAIAHLTGAESVTYFHAADQEVLDETPAPVILEPLSVYGGRGSRPEAIGPLQAGEIPPLTKALETRQPVILSPGQGDDSRLALLDHISPDNKKPDRRSWLLLQPVYRDEEILGLLLVQSNEDPDWAAANGDTIDLLATLLINSLTQVRYRQLIKEQATRIDGLKHDTEQSQEDVVKLDTLVDHHKLKIVELEEKIAHLEAARKAELAAEQIRLEAEPMDKAMLLQRPAIEYIAHVTQELRRPVASILGYSELLLGGSGGKLGELQQLFLERIKAGSERIVLLIEDLLRVVSPDWAPFLVNLKPVNIVNLIDEAIGVFSEQLELKSIQVRKKIDLSLPKLELDPGRIRQIVFYLLSNALHSSPANSQVLLEVSYQIDTSSSTDSDKQRGFLFISVSDMGSGAVNGARTMISEGERKDVENGDGIGEGAIKLSDVKELVQVHGGRIWIENEPEVSNTLRLILPASVAA